MERLCFTFEIRPGTEAEYKKRHDEIWPELVEAIKDAGLSNYSLFRRGTTIYGYAEVEPDVETAACFNDSVIFFSPSPMLASRSTPLPVRHTEVATTSSSAW